MQAKERVLHLMEDLKTIIILIRLEREIVLE